MPFERLQALGEERFTKILNAVIRGEQSTKVARLIQKAPPDGWGEMQDVQELTLAQQLNRLRQAIAEGTFGLRQAKNIAANHTPHIRMLERVSVKVLDRMEELAEWQRERAQRLMEREKDGLLPTPGPSNLKMDLKVVLNPVEARHLLTQTNAVFNDYRETLVVLQDMRFKLGLDEFKGPVNTVKGASQTTTYPDGMSVQKQVFEAVSTIEQIFDARKIP